MTNQTIANRISRGEPLSSPKTPVAFANDVEQTLFEIIVGHAVEVPNLSELSERVKQTLKLDSSEDWKPILGGN